MGIEFIKESYGPDSANSTTAVVGLTLRDLFAMAALAGLTASGDSGGAKIAAMDAYEFADAMLAARDKEETP